MTGAAMDSLTRDLAAAMWRGPDVAWRPGDFAEVALRCFALQFARNDAYRALCEARGVTPGTIARWEDAPLVPATAFKHLDFITGPPDSAKAVFRTSGTTLGGSKRGRHLVPDLSLYRASCVANFGAYLLPDGVRPPLLSLVPSPEQAPDSSLSAMVGMVAEPLCSGVRWMVDGDGAIDAGALREAAESEEPLLLVGTALAFVRVLDTLAREPALALPPGSRIMETGGFKGWKTPVSRSDLYRRITAGLGVPGGRIVNEYGMTELLSQLYEPVLREPGSTDRRHEPPPWLVVRALDPITLAPLSQGEEGLLAFFDLANVGSVCHVLTEDVGSVTPEGVSLVGRVPGAEPRGCSRAMEELMGLAADGRQMEAR